MVVLLFYFMFGGIKSCFLRYSRMIVCNLLDYLGRLLMLVLSVGTQDCVLSTVPKVLVETTMYDNTHICISQRRHILPRAAMTAENFVCVKLLVSVAWHWKICETSV